MKIRIKKLHPDAKMPTRGTSGAAAFDLYASKTVGLPPSLAVKVPTGLAFEIPEGYCGMIYTRSSSPIRGLQVHTTVIDSDYRGAVVLSIEEAEKIEKFFDAVDQCAENFRLDRSEMLAWANLGEKIRRAKRKEADE